MIVPTFLFGWNLPIVSVILRFGKHVTGGSNILQGVCRDKGRGVRLHGVLAFPINIARIFALGCRVYWVLNHMTCHNQTISIELASHGVSQKKTYKITENNDCFDAASTVWFQIFQPWKPTKMRWNRRLFLTQRPMLICINLHWLLWLPECAASHADLCFRQTVHWLSRPGVGKWWFNGIWWDLPCGKLTELWGITILNGKTQST